MIAVLDYGIGNLRSAQKALVHLGADALLVTNPHEAEGAAGVVLPGVGAFGRCMKALESSGLVDVVRDVIEKGTPLLGICVGLQMLYESSDEAPGVAGLGVLRGSVRALSRAVKSPQMQWNQLSRTGGDGSRLLAGLGEDPWVYFLHSYAPQSSAQVVATCDYGGEVVAAVEDGAVWGTQFHPEKSGSVGLAMLTNFVAACTGGEGSSRDGACAST